MIFLMLDEGVTLSQHHRRPQAINLTASLDQTLRFAGFEMISGVELIGD
jgi:hypothetical protein